MFLRSSVWQMGPARPTPIRLSGVQHRGNATKQSAAWSRTPCTSASACSSTPTPYSASPSSNDGNPQSSPFYQAVSKVSVLVRRGCANLVVDNSRASSSRTCWRDSLWRRIWRVEMRDQRRRRIRAGPHGQRRRRACVATFRFGKVEPSSPSACRAAASCPARHLS